MWGAHTRYMDVELQQRAVEYLSLERRPELARANVTPMPPWEKRKSLLLRRMAEREVCAPSQIPPCLTGNHAIGSAC